MTGIHRAAVLTLALIGFSAAPSRAQRADTATSYALRDTAATKGPRGFNPFQSPPQSLALFADLPTTRVGARNCPMPVFTPDSSRKDHIVATLRDSIHTDHIPVATLSCENPLRVPARPR